MLSPRSMRRSSSLNVARVLAIASEWAPARLSATAATLTGPPESANNRRTARSTGVPLAARRAPARASTSLSPSSSAVLITRFAKIGLLLTWDEGRVCTNSRLKAFFGEGGGMDQVGRIAIGRMSKHTGTNIETIRYYERVGLLPAPARSSGGYRLYGTDHLKRLSFIRRARALGFSIVEVRT